MTTDSRTATYRRETILMRHLPQAVCATLQCARAQGYPRASEAVHVSARELLQAVHATGQSQGRAKPGISSLVFVRFQSRSLTAKLSLTRTSSMLPRCDSWRLGSHRWRIRPCSLPKSETYGRTLRSCISTAIKESRVGGKIAGLRSGASPTTATAVRPTRVRVHHPGRAVKRAAQAAVTTNARKRTDPARPRPTRSGLPREFFSQTRHRWRMEAVFH